MIPGSDLTLIGHKLDYGVLLLEEYYIHIPKSNLESVV